MYSYEAQRPALFSDDGQRMFLKIRDNVLALLKQSGAVTLECAISGVTGDSWDMIACVDRMVELGELTEIHNSRYPGTSNFRIFMRAYP